MRHRSPANRRRRNRRRDRRTLVVIFARQPPFVVTPSQPDGLAKVATNTALGCSAVISLILFAWAKTNHLPYLLSLMALPGLFALLAGTLPEARRRQLQEPFDRALQTSMLTVFMILGILALWTLFFATGVLVLRNPGNQQHALISLTAPSSRATSSPAFYLAPTAASKHPVLPWKRGDWQVKVQGLPAQRVALSSKTKTLNIPDDFFARPVILMRANPQLTLDASASYSNMLLQVHLHGRQYDLAFRGHSAWIGGLNDILIPDRIRGQWQRDLEAARMTPALMSLWLNPDSIASDSELQQGDEVRLELLPSRDHRVPVACLSITVKPTNIRQGFIQNAILDHTDSSCSSS